jgi:hypothetical protein
VSVSSACLHSLPPVIVVEVGQSQGSLAGLVWLQIHRVRAFVGRLRKKRLQRLPLWRHLHRRGLRSIGSRSVAIEDDVESLLLPLMFEAISGVEVLDGKLVLSATLLRSIAVTHLDFHVALCVAVQPLILSIDARYFSGN